MFDMYMAIAVTLVEIVLSIGFGILIFAAGRLVYLYASGETNWQDHPSYEKGMKHFLMSGNILNPYAINNAQSFVNYLYFVIILSVYAAVWPVSIPCLAVELSRAYNLKKRKTCDIEY